MRKRVAVPVVLVIWLVIGLVAAGQRGYLGGGHDCAGWGNMLVTILVGPLNYVGVNPDVECPGVPEPSD